MNIKKTFQKLRSFQGNKKIKQDILDRYLHINPIDKEKIITIKKNNIQEKWNVEKFEKEMEVQYLPHLCFEKEKDLFWVFNKCAKAFLNGFITDKQKWTGIFFEREMIEGKIASTYLQWIDPIMEWGLFAKEDIQIYAFVGQYTGIVHRYKKTVDDHNAYCFEYSIGEEISTHLTIDAKEKGNLTRFINHSFSPNIFQTALFLDGIMHVVFRAKRKIKKGEQLTYNYGWQYWKKREKPL